MMNQHKNQYNPAIYVSLRTGAMALAIAGLLSACYIPFISAMGKLYNPLFRLPAWMFNTILGRHILPYSVRDFKGMGSYGDNIVGLIYIMVMYALTFYLVMFAGFYIAALVNDYALEYKPDAEYLAAYMKEQQEKVKIKSQQHTLSPGLEIARREHFEQWKKCYKSNLSYDEWKKKFCA